MELTELQKAMVSRRLDAIRADVPVVALRLLCEDGTEWKVGEFPQPVVPQAAPAKKRRPYTNRRLPGERKGELSKAVEDWLRFIEAFNGESVFLRPSDMGKFDSQPARFMSCMSARACALYGGGHLSVMKQNDGSYRVILS